jgi:hypothetical protein
MINLDDADIETLMAFWAKHQRGRGYRELFPEGGALTVKATADLANYAANKATAMREREAGRIPSALIYERIAGRIYAALPHFALW